MVGKSLLRSVGCRTMFERNSGVEALNYAVMKDVVENLSHHEVTCRTHYRQLAEEDYVDTCVE